MMESYDYTGLLKQYLDGSLPPDDKALLERQLANDPALRQSLESLRQQQQVLDRLTAQKLKTKMTEWDAENPPDPISSKKNGWWPPLLLCALLTVFILYKNTQTDPKPVGQDNQVEVEKDSIPSTDADPKPQKTISPGSEDKTPETMPAPKQPNLKKPIAYTEEAHQLYEKLNTLQNLVRGSETDADSIAEVLLAADAAYQKGDYKNAIKNIRTLATESPNASRLQLVLGRLYFEAGDYRAAVETLRPIAEKPSLYAAQAEWYLLLAYLARYDIYQKEFDKLKGGILAEPEHFGYEKVKKIKMGT